GTPYARVIQRGGQVVLLGAPLDTITLVHHAEAIARVDGQRRAEWHVPGPTQNEGGRATAPSWSTGSAGGGRSTTSTRARAPSRTTGSPAAPTTSSISRELLSSGARAAPGRAVAEPRKCSTLRPWPRPPSG